MPRRGPGWIGRVRSIGWRFHRGLLWPHLRGACWLRGHARHPPGCAASFARHRIKLRAFTPIDLGHLYQGGGTTACTMRWSEECWLGVHFSCTGGRSCAAPDRLAPRAVPARLRHRRSNPQQAGDLLGSCAADGSPASGRHKKNSTNVAAFVCRFRLYRRKEN